MPALISIIIPIYNHSKTLPKSVSSIILQTYRPLEVIMVNDGSTDGSGYAAEEQRKTLEKYGIKTQVIHQQNSGAASARNRGFKEARGEYVIFWDADTIAKPEMLKKMRESLAMHPLISFVYSKFKFGWKTMRGHEFDAEKLKHVNFIDSTSLMRTKDFPSQGWDERLKRFQDWDLFLTMAEQGKKGEFIPELLFFKIVQGRVGGMSKWMPGFAYRLPWKMKRVREYEEAREIVMRKHNIK